MGDIVASDQAKHIEIKGIRDGKAHCKCGWKSAFGGKYREHHNNLVQDNSVIEELERLYRDMGWFGAQGNLVNPDTAWAGVTACREVIKDRINELKTGQ